MFVRTFVITFSYGSGSDSNFFTSYGSGSGWGSGSTRQKVMVPTVRFRFHNTYTDYCPLPGTSELVLNNSHRGYQYES